MKVRIQVAPEDDAKARGILVRHSPGEAYPDRIVVISEEAVAALRDAGVHFTEISREPGIVGALGVISGERV